MTLCHKCEGKLCELGVLGGLLWLRCQGCGHDYSLEIEATDDSSFVFCDSVSLERSPFGRLD